MKSGISNFSNTVALLGVMICGSLAALQAAETAPNARPAIAIADVKRTDTVDFEKEILPIFRNNCLACHNQTTVKGELILETPETILKGGETGPAVVRGKSGESLLLQLAAHQKRPMMPPKDNKVAAVELTPEELGLVKLWIDQGAKGEVHNQAAPIAWQPLPDGLNPIYAVALTPDGQYAACGRANQIFIYHVPTGQLVTRLTDPQLYKSNPAAKPGVAHLDLVHALAFSPDGNILASGGYREVKLWKRPRDVRKLGWELSNTVASVVFSPNGKWLATATASNRIEIRNASTGELIAECSEQEKAPLAWRFSPDNLRLCSLGADKKLALWSATNGALVAETNLESEASSLTWLPNNSQVAIGGVNGQLALWKIPESTNSWALLKEWKGHETNVTVLETVNQKEILSADANGIIRQWNVEKGEKLQEMKHGGAVASLAVRPDGKRFASAGGTNVARLWDASSGKALSEMKGDRYLQDAIAAADRALKVAAGDITFRKTKVDAAEKEVKAQEERLKKGTDALAAADKTLQEKQKALTAATETSSAAEKALAALNAELKDVTDKLAAAEAAAKAATAEAKTAMERATLAKIVAEQSALTKADVERVASDASAVAARTKTKGDNAAPPSEKILADADAVAAKARALAEAVAADAGVKLKAATEARSAAEKAIDEVASKSYAAGQSRVLFEKTTNGAPERIKLAGEKFAAATNSFVAAEKEYKKAEQTHSIAKNEHQLAEKASQQASESLAAGKAAFAAAEEAKKQRESALELAKKTATEAERPIRALVFSPDNQVLASSGEDSLVHTWSAENGSPFEIWHGHTGAVSAVRFVKPGVLVSVAADQKVLTWDLRPDWTLERVIGTSDATSPLADRVNALRFSPDGKLLATGGGEPTRGGEIKLWKTSDGTLASELKNVHSDAVFSLDFSPDGKYLASGASDKFVRVTELSSGKVVKSFEGHTHHVLGVSWKADGRTLVSSGADNVVKVWDFVSGDKKKNIEGFSKEVTGISFIGVTDQALTSSGDNQVRLVKETGENVRTFEGPSDFMYSAAATPDGAIVVAGGQDSILRVWNGTDGKPLATLQVPGK